MSENPQHLAGEPDESRETGSAGEQPGAGREDAPLPRADSPKSAIVYCVRCGATMGPGDLFCHACGWNARASLPAPVRAAVNPSDKSRLAALLLCVLLGWLGAHRFYVGRVGTAVLWLFSLGFLGIGVIYDLVLIATGEFRDDQSRRVVHWE